MLRAVSPSVLSSTTQNALVTTQGGLTGYVPSVIFCGTAQAITSGTGASSWIPTGVGTVTIPANFMVPGKTLRVRAMGQMTTSGTQGTVIFGLALGTSTLWTSGAQTATASLTNVSFQLDLLITCQTTGSGGTCSFSGQVSYDLGPILAIDTLFSNALNGVALNTTLSNLLSITTTNSVSSGTVFTINNFVVEALL